MNLYDFVAESNRIEGILREPTSEEIAVHEEFLGLSAVTIPDLENFVNICQPGEVLRDIPGLDVRVGSYYPPEGGPLIKQQLTLLLEDIDIHDAFDIHQRYETLHPFTDVNGRSGRVLWLYQMNGDVSLGFLHRWYYQSLDKLQSRQKLDELAHLLLQEKQFENR